MRICYLLIIFFSSTFVFAQEEVEIQYGDTLYFGQCEAEAYTYIDYYNKTRFELDSISFDTINGWDFYNRFFNTGDFDVSRLPKSFQGTYGIVKHMMSIENSEGDWINVVIVMIQDGKSAAYIVEEAFIEEEVIFAPAQ